MPNFYEEKWNEKFNELVKYREEAGHCRVPVNSSGSLGAWVNNQRFAYKKGKQRYCQTRIARLEAIGFEWNPRQGRPVADDTLPISCAENRWNEKFNELVKFREEAGHCRVPVNGSGSLGAWVSNQRFAYRTKGKKLRGQRIARLDAIGFEWELGHGRTIGVDDRWEGRCAELVQFKRRHGHCNIPYLCPANPKLGRWVQTQRSLYRKEALSEERIERLEEMEFVWEHPDWPRARRQACASEGAPSPSGDSSDAVGAPGEGSATRNGRGRGKATTRRSLRRTARVQSTPKPAAEARLTDEEASGDSGAKCAKNIHTDPPKKPTTKTRTGDLFGIDDANEETELLKQQLADARKRIVELSEAKSEQLAETRKRITELSEEKSELQQEVLDLRSEAVARTAEISLLNSSMQSHATNGEESVDTDEAVTPFVALSWLRRE